MDHRAQVCYRFLPRTKVNQFRIHVDTSRDIVIIQDRAINVVSLVRALLLAADGAERTVQSMLNIHTNGPGTTVVNNNSFRAKLA